MRNKGWATEEELDKALNGMILSASGWRGIFANGNGESRGADISPAHRLIAAAAARVFADRLKNAPGEMPSPVAPLVLVGTDTRPTGPAIADAVITALLAAGCRVRYAGVVAAPEIMAWVRYPGLSAAGFLYISASHNPIGHNGLKFGLADGGVLGGKDAAVLIEAFKAEFRMLTAAPGSAQGSASGEGRIKALQSLQDAPGEAQLEKVYIDLPFTKKEAYRAYFDFTAQVVYGAADAGLKKAIAQGLEAYPLKLVCDFNGSARTLSIDREFLAGLGLPL
jgi:phosphoglucomutase